MTSHRTLAAALACIVTTVASAAPATVPSQDEKAVAAFTERFAAANPRTVLSGVRVSPIPGVFEVVLGKNIGYADASGRYLLLGHLWDMTAGKDLTAEPKAALDKVDVQSLPVQMALHHKAGKGTRTLYVFADPMCGYCKQLEGALAEVDDVTVHTFVIPILGEESQRLATAIACSPDPAGSWRAWMREGKQPPAASPSCTPPIDELQRVARGAGVSATPTLVAADGRRFAGAMPAARLATWLAEGSLAQATAVTATVKTAKR